MAEFSVKVAFLLDIAKKSSDKASKVAKRAILAGILDLDNPGFRKFMNTTRNRLP